MSLCPVILSGGSGTRLWPMSRESYPKQFLPLLSGESPFQSTVRRVNALSGAQPPIVVAHQDHRFLVEDQMKKVLGSGALLGLVARRVVFAMVHRVGVLMGIEFEVAHRVTPIR